MCSWCFSSQLSAGFGDWVVPSSLLMVFSVGSHLLSCLVTFILLLDFCIIIVLSFVIELVMWKSLSFLVLILKFVRQGRPGHFSV